MGEEYQCITRNRRNRKRRDTGSGGLAVIVRNGWGKIKIAKEKGSDEILWVEIEWLGKRIFIAVVYLVPVKSTRFSDNPDIRRELEEDIGRFRNLGMIVVMGDLNSRIDDMVPEGEEGGMVVRPNLPGIPNW